MILLVFIFSIRNLLLFSSIFILKGSLLLLKLLFLSVNINNFCSSYFLLSINALISSICFCCSSFILNNFSSSSFFFLNLSWYCFLINFFLSKSSISCLLISIIIFSLLSFSSKINFCFSFSSCSNFLRSFSNSNVRISSSSSIFLIITDSKVFRLQFS